MWLTKNKRHIFRSSIREFSVFVPRTKNERYFRTDNSFHGCFTHTEIILEGLTKSLFQYRRVRISAIAVILVAHRLNKIDGFHTENWWTLVTSFAPRFIAHLLKSSLTFDNLLSRENCYSCFRARKDLISTIFPNLCATTDLASILCSSKTENN